VKHFFILLYILIFGLVSVNAQEEEAPGEIDTYFYFNQRIPGDFSLSIKLGSAFGLGYSDMDGAFTESNITPGLLLGLELEWYLNNNFKLGTSFTGLMAWSPNWNPVYLAPMTITGTYEFKIDPQTYDLPLFGPSNFAMSIPVHLGLGVTQASYLDSRSLSPTAVLGTGFFVHPSSSFAYGLKTNYWLVGQWHDGSLVPENHSRIGHFLEASLALIYTP